MPKLLLPIECDWLARGRHAMSDDGSNDLEHELLWEIIDAIASITAASDTPKESSDA